MGTGFVWFLFSFLGAFFSVPAWSFHVIVDPGHGGKDRGAVHGSFFESQINLKVARLLAEELKKDPSIKVSLTRHTDRFISLQQRAQFAHKEKGDLFISIHINSSPDVRARGAEFYFQNQLPPDEEALYLANRENESPQGENAEMEREAFLPSSLQASAEVKNILLDLIHGQKIFDSSYFTKTLREHWQGNQRSKQTSIRQAPFYVVSEVQIPSVLVELGFITHPKEGPKLNQKTYQSLMAKSLFNGIQSFKESLDKVP